METLTSPRVIAFADNWSPDTAEPRALAAIRADLRAIGASLTVHAGVRAYRVCGDRAIEELSLTEGDPSDAWPRGTLRIVLVDESEKPRFSRVVPADADATALLASALATARRTLESPNGSASVSRHDLVLAALASALAMAAFEACAGPRPTARASSAIPLAAPRV